MTQPPSLSFSANGAVKSGRLEQQPIQNGRIGQPRTVLLVEDSPEDRELYRRYLQRDPDFHYTLIEASLGQEGLTLWQHHQPDAVLLDFRLPDLDGLEFLAQLQQHTPESYLPVIVVTGQGNESIAVQALKMGAQDYLVKGQITPEGLRFAVNEAIEKIQLRIELNQRIERERLVAQITQQIHRSLELDQILQTTVDEVRQFLQTDRVIIFRLEENGSGTVVTESVATEWQSILSSNIHDPCFAESYIERYRQGLVTSKTDVNDGSIDPCHVELLTRFQVKANLVVPILQDDQLWGMIIAHHCATPRHWQSLEVDLLKELATQVGIALQQAELYQQARSELGERQRAEATLRQQTDRERLVSEIAQRVRQSLDVTAILQTTVNEVRCFLQTDRVFVYRFQPDFNGTIVVESVGEHWLPIVNAEVQDTYFVETKGEDYRQGRIQAVADIYNANLTPCHIDLLARFQVRANLAVPILNGNRLWGLLVANHCAAPRYWQSLEIGLLQQLTTQVGIALQQAELYEQAQTELVERRRVEVALRESEERFRQLAENIEAVFWITEVLEQRVSYISPAYERLWGLDRQEIYNNRLNWVNLIHPDDRAAINQAFAEKASHGKFDEEYRIVLPDGTIRWVRDRCFPLYTPSGQVYRFTGIAEDITERKFFDQTLQESEERFRTSVENMLDCFGIYQAMRNDQGQIIDFCVEYVNEAACVNNYLTREQQVGRGLCEILPTHRENGLFEEYCQVVETGQPLVKESLIYEDYYGQQRLIRAFDIRIAKFQDGFVATWRDITDRKRTEDTLRDNEQLLRLALSGAQAGSWDWQIQTGKVTWSPENYILYGIMPAEGVPQYEHWYNALHPDDRDRANAEVSQTVEQRLPEFRSEYRIIHPERGIRWLLGLGRLTLNEQGEPIRLSGINLDITDRKLAELAIQERETRLTLVHQATESGCWDWDLTSDSSYISEEYCQLFGLDLTLEQISFEQWLTLVHPDDRTSVTEVMNRAFEQQQEYHGMEYRIVISQGVRWITSKAKVFYDATGRATRMLGNVQDITDRKQAELEQERLLRREQQYVTRLRGLTQASLSINSIATIQEVLNIITAQAHLIIGCHQAVTSMSINQDWSHAITAIYLSDKYAQWRDYTEEPDGSGIYSLVCQLNRPIRMTQAELEAHPRWNKFGKAADKHPPIRGWLAVPLVDREGHNIGVIQLSDKFEGDFTEEDETILVQLAQMASVAIENTRLYEAEQEARTAAERANQVKDEFLAILSHELRSPLNPILGWTKLLQTGQLDVEKTATALTTIERNARLQTQLIDDLLDVSKILRGKLSMNVAPVKLGFVIEAAIDTVKTAAAAKSIQLHPVLSNVEPMMGDAARLQQIIWNLLSNAVKFTPPHGRVDIRLERVGNQAQMTVSDTGKGINPNFLPHVFESFRQEDASTTRQYGGLGLGLAIVRSLVEAHGGTISADSLGEGQGATFTLQFPLLNIESTTEQPSESSKQPLDLTGIRILTVDDEVDARDLLTALLTQFGAEVLTVSSAAEVLQTIGSFQPNLLISDIGMPGTDGYALLEQIRALPTHQGGQIPAIAVTAYAREEDQQRSLKSGFQCHISKPLDPLNLVQSILTLLNNS